MNFWNIIEASAVATKRPEAPMSVIALHRSGVLSAQAESSSPNRQFLPYDGWPHCPFGHVPARLGTDLGTALGTGTIEGKSREPLVPVLDPSLHNVPDAQEIVPNPVITITFVQNFTYSH